MPRFECPDAARRWYDPVISRRELLIAIGAGALAVPRWAWAQPAERTFRIGWFSSVDWAKEAYNVAFVQRLSELGFVEGRNLVFERRDTGGRPERMPGLAAELVRQKCDLLFAGGQEAALIAMKQASRDAPIVIVALDYDPVATGHVTNLARPGGRITGVSAVQSLLPAKRLELLKELLPAARKVAVFGNAGTTGQLKVVQDTARHLGIALHVVDFKSPPFDYEAGFADAVRAKPDALLVLTSGLFVTGRRKIWELALKHRLASMSGGSQSIEAGALLSYGFNFSDLYRRAAEQTAAILRGAKAADIPMEQGTKFEMVLNMKTARALGIKIPQSILLRADRVIE